LVTNIKFTDDGTAWATVWSGPPAGGIYKSAAPAIVWARQPTIPAITYMTGIDFITPMQGWSIGYETGDPACPGDNQFHATIFATADGGGLWREGAHLCGISGPIQGFDADHIWALTSNPNAGKPGIYLVSGDGFTATQQEVRAGLNNLMMLDIHTGW